MYAIIVQFLSLGITYPSPSIGGRPGSSLLAFPPHKQKGKCSISRCDITICSEGLTFSSSNYQTKCLRRRIGKKERTEYVFLFVVSYLVRYVSNSIASLSVLIDFNNYYQRYLMGLNSNISLAIYISYQLLLLSPNKKIQYN